MESSKIFAKIKELGHINSKKDELREYCKLKFDQIEKFLPSRILHSDGADLLDCIFNGLPDIGGSSKCKIKIIDIVLQVMRKQSTSLSHTGDVISRLCLDLTRSPPHELVRWSGDSIQSIVEDKDVNMIWKDILPECLNGLSSYDTVKHCGTDMTPAEFKEQCVATLCQCRWKEDQLVPMAAMFKDMQLSREDHKKVVNKLCSFMIDVPPESMPPLVHQLVKLCKTQNVELVLLNLSQYFNVRLYNKLQPAQADSESTTMDIEEIVPYSSAELGRCLSTCIYHITQGAADPELVRKQLKLWPRSQLLRSPFLLELALALTSKGADFRTVCIDIIKSAIEQRVIDTIKAKESAWIRSVLPLEVDVASVLKVLTAGSGNELELTVLGLINLAFSLLSVPRQKPSAPQCHSYGKLVLVRLCKSRPETASHVLSQLADRLAGDLTSQRQYADCLYVLCKLTPQSLERCPQLCTILENCQPSPVDYRAAAAVLDAVHPLLHFSTKVRDSMVMVCRKGLYSRDSLHRCLALSGFLSLLRHVKLPRSFGSSQSACSEQLSAHSYLTQLCVDLHATQSGPVTSRVRNEAMCMEVVSILRRCLVQDATVKQLLYSSIYVCAKEKQALHESILELLHEQVSRYLPEAEVGAPLLFDKCVQVNGANAVLIEPVGHLLYSISQFLQSQQEEELEDILESQPMADAGAAFLKSKLMLVMSTLAGGNLGNVDMEDPSLTDLTPESKAKCLKLQQMLQCYEALIAHQVLCWNASDKKVATSVYNLFKAYSELLDKTKAPPKQGKKSTKSTQNDTRDTLTSQKSQKSQKDKGKRPLKFGNMVKDKAGPFKPLPCLWDLPFCLRMLDLLYSEEVSWSSIEQRNYIRTKRDFHQFSLRCAQAALASDHADRRMVAANVHKMAEILYRRCLSRFQDMCDFDEATTQLCIEVFKDCLNVLLSQNYGFKVDTFLPTITGLPETPVSTCIAAILEQIHASLSHLEAESEEEERDASSRKLATSLMQTATLLLGVPVSDCCARMTSIIAKLEDYVQTSKHECLALISALLDAGCRMQQDSRLLDVLIDKLTVVLGRIDEEDTSVQDESSVFPSVEPGGGGGGGGALTAACAHAGVRCAHAQALLSRAAPPHVPALHTDQERAEQKEVLKSLTMQLCQLSGWVWRLAQLRCPVGGGSDRVLQCCVRLYATLAAFVKILDASSLQDIRLDRLLKLSGKKLSAVTDNLITYVEGVQPQQQGARKVMRDTKLIPRLVLEAEQFTKHVLLLSNKAKLNLQQYLSLGTARDFRIKAPVLQQVLAADDNDVTHNDATAQEDINDAETALASATTDIAPEGNKRKKRRVS